MQDRLIFLIGPPRSGSTLLARMLGAHSAIHSPAEPHLMTPLAHLGFHAKVDTAPYDPNITQEALRALVSDLPKGEADYLDALRAFSDSIYTKLRDASGRPFLLDKTPAYALVLDFIARLYPKAHYIVLTRNPFAIWTSAVDSFFAGQHRTAHEHNPLLERYVPAIARFLRDPPVPLAHVRYEALVQDPDAELQRLCDHIGIPFEPGMVDYGKHDGGRTETARGLGDPMTVASQSRPTTASLERWRADLVGHRDRVAQCHEILEQLMDDDLASWGFERAELAAELDAIDTTAPRKRRTRTLNRYWIERRVLLALRRAARRPGIGGLVRKLRYACDLVLR